MLRKAGWGIEPARFTFYGARNGAMDMIGALITYGNADAIKFKSDCP